MVFVGIEFCQDSWSLICHLNQHNTIICTKYFKYLTYHISLIKMSFRSSVNNTKGEKPNKKQCPFLKAKFKWKLIVADRELINFHS